MTVHFIGAGPGAADLLTLRAARALSKADVVLLDHLAPQEYGEYAPNALIVDVGKVPGKHAVPQSRIQQLMIDYALSGKTVVRLKGGDPYVYGRGAEELDACIAAGLEAEVIPGITSAIAVPARAAIPVTLRKVSSIFTVISGHSGLSETEVSAVEATLRAQGTVVLLMGVLLPFAVLAGEPVVVGGDDAPPAGLALWNARRQGPTRRVLPPGSGASEAAVSKAE